MFGNTISKMKGALRVSYLTVVKGWHGVLHSLVVVRSHIIFQNVADVCYNGDMYCGIKYMLIH